MPARINQHLPNRNHIHLGTVPHQNTPFAHIPHFDNFPEYIAHKRQIGQRFLVQKLRAAPTGG